MKKRVLLAVLAIWPYAASPEPIYDAVESRIDTFLYCAKWRGYSYRGALELDAARIKCDRVTVKGRFSVTSSLGGERIWYYRATLQRILDKYELRSFETRVSADGATHELCDGRSKCCD
jgi:hypothetical protein